MLAELMTATVHTTGINWTSVGTIAGTILGSVGGAARYVVSRVEHSRADAQAMSEKFVTRLVAQVTAIVDLKVNQVNEHLADQDRRTDQVSRQVSDVRDRTARIEGQLSGRPPRTSR